MNLSFPTTVPIVVIFKHEFQQLADKAGQRLESQLSKNTRDTKFTLSFEE